MNELMLAIADYAIAQGWTPIRHRTFHVGPWAIEINGTEEAVSDLQPSRPA